MVIRVRGEFFFFNCSDVERGQASTAGHLFKGQEKWMKQPYNKNNNNVVVFVFCLFVVVVVGFCIV